MRKIRPKRRLFRFSSLPTTRIGGKVSGEEKKGKERCGDGIRQSAKGLLFPPYFSHSPTGKARWTMLHRERKNKIRGKKKKKEKGKEREGAGKI